MAPMFVLYSKYGIIVRQVQYSNSKVTQMSALSELPEVFTTAAVPRSTASDAVARGELRRLARGLYTRNLTDPPEQVIRRNLYDVVASLYPAAVISDRSARLGGRPTGDGSLFLVHDRAADAVLPGLTLRPRRGPTGGRKGPGGKKNAQFENIPRLLGQAPRSLSEYSLFLT